MPDLIEMVDVEDRSWANVGPTAAIVAALAAGVVAEAARRSTDVWDEAAGAAAQAAALRRRAIGVARDDREAHLAARAALEEARAGGSVLGDGTLAVTLARAADLPLEIASAGADAAELGAVVTEHCAADMKADAAGAAALAAGAVEAATELIEVNLSTGPDDERLRRALELRAAAEAASDRALEESS